MTNDKLSESYLKKATVRIKALKFLHQEKDYSDVIRESHRNIRLTSITSAYIERSLPQIFPGMQFQSHRVVTNRAAKITTSLLGRDPF